MKGIGKETTEYLQKELQGVIHPWQYKDSDIHIINIESVLSDVLSNWNEEIRFRQGFAINEDNSINIPTMFVQINGIFNDKNKYREFLDSLETKNSIRFKNTKNLFKENTGISKKLDNLQFEDCDLAKMKINFEKRKKYLLNTKFNTFDSINESARNLLYLKFKEFVNNYPELDSKVYSKIINLDKKILNLLQNFDYCFANPKIIVENMNDKEFYNEDKYVLMFLYSLGFDIVIFSPKGLKFLDDYKINSITLDSYLNQDIESYDYRADKDIKKEEKDKLKKEKKTLKKKRFSNFLSMFPILIILIGIILCICIAIYEDNLSEEAKMKHIESSMNFETPTRIAYVDSDNPTIYNYPTDDYESSINENISLDKNDEIEVVKENSTWVQFKESNTLYYIKKDDIRDKYYQKDINTFELNLVANKKTPIYQMEDKNSEVIANYKKDDNIVAIGYTKDFYQVKKGNKVGFIEKDLINLEETTNITEKDNLTFGGILLAIIICCFLLFYIIFFVLDIFFS